MHLAFVDEVPVEHVSVPEDDVHVNPPSEEDQPVSPNYYPVWLYAHSHTGTQSATASGQSVDPAGASVTITGMILIVILVLGFGWLLFRDW